MDVVWMVLEIGVSWKIIVLRPGNDSVHPQGTTLSWMILSAISVQSPPSPVLYKHIWTMGAVRFLLWQNPDLCINFDPFSDNKPRSIPKVINMSHSYSFLYVYLVWWEVRCNTNNNYQVQEMSSLHPTEISLK